MKTRALAALVVSSTALIFSSVPAQARPNSAIAPQSREGDAGWMARHEGFNKRVAKGEVDLIFIGDSITQGWETEGKQVWSKYFGLRNAVNLGISGDRTQHALWRLAHGNIDRIKPKLAVIMIGTNNSNGNDNTAEEIAEGIKSIVQVLRSKLPSTKVLILAIFPRGELPNPQREKNAKASKLASELADDKNVFFLDIGPQFLNEDGALSKEIMPDFLHLTPKAYEIWAEAIEDKVAQLMGEGK